VTEEKPPKIVHFHEPTQCVLWEQPDYIAGNFAKLLDEVESYEDSSHLIRSLYKCRECAQLYRRLVIDQKVPGLRFADDKSSTYRLRGLVMGTAIAIGAIVAANVIILTHLHQSVSRDEHRNLLRQSLVLSAIVERTFQSVDLVLTSVVEKVRLAAATGGGVGQLTNQSTQAFLGPNTLVFRHEEGPE